MIKCYWALAAINFKNNKRVTACPRNSSSMHDLSKGKLPSKFINSQGFKNLRTSLHSDTWSQECKSCLDFENQQIQSYRQKQNDQYWNDRLLNGFNADTGDIDLRNIEYIEFRFSNACNLSCLHCAPSYSSKWQSIVRKVNVNEQDKEHNIHYLTDQGDNQSWTLQEVDDLLNDLKLHFPNLKRLDIAGGEPLYQKQFWRFLEGILDHPNISNMEIVMISNFNTEVDYVKLSQLLMNFKKSCIRISVDGSEKIYKYFRSGVYSNIEKNITTFRTRNQKTILEATNTISVYQLFDFKNTIADMSRLGVDRLHHSFVQYPTYLSPSALPNKTKFLEEIQNSRELINDKMSKEMCKSIQKMIERTTEYVKKTKFVDTDMNALLYYTQRTDTIKNQHFEKVYGKNLEDLLNE